MPTHLDTLTHHVCSTQRVDCGAIGGVACYLLHAERHGHMMCTAGAPLLYTLYGIVEHIGGLLGLLTTFTALLLHHVPVCRRSKTRLPY